jgi:nitroreductase
MARSIPLQEGIKMNEVLDAIKNRRSTRAYRPEQISEEELAALIEAGIYAPSASNQQPWHFSVIQKKDLIDRLSEEFSCMARQSDSDYFKKFGNREDFHVFYHSPTVIVLSGDAARSTAIVDTAAAVQNILIAAESMDIGSCWIGLMNLVFGSEKGADYYDEIGIPDGYKFMHAVALGYKMNQSANAPRRKENTVNYVK